MSNTLLVWGSSFSKDAVLCVKEEMGGEKVQTAEEVVPFHQVCVKGTKK